MIITFYYNIDGLEDFIYEWASSDKEILIFFPFENKDSEVLFEDFYVGF